MERLQEVREHWPAPVKPPNSVWTAVLVFALLSVLI